MTDYFKSVDMDTLATVTRTERDPFGPGGRSCFIAFPDTPTAKCAIADLILAGLAFTVAGFFEMTEGTTEVWFGLQDVNHDTYCTPAGDAMEEAFHAYAKSLGGTYAGS